MTANLSPTPGKTYLEWLADTLKLVSDTQDILKHPLDPKTLNDQSTQCEDYHVQLAEALSQAEAWLAWHEAAEMGRIDADLTVDRQNIELKKRMIPHRLLRDKLEALTMSMKSRMRRCAWHS